MRFYLPPVEIAASRKNLASKYHIVAHVGEALGATLVPKRRESDIYTILIEILRVKGFLGISGEAFFILSWRARNGLNRI
jgi:hypothetical protein